jgi:hypothetical protein
VAIFIIKTVLDLCIVSAKEKTSAQILIHHTTQNMSVRIGLEHLTHACFVMQYIHIIRGEELYRLARDYTKYLVTGKRTSRLKRAMLNWRDFSDGITKKGSTQDDVYGSPVASESMWWQQPQKLVHNLGNLFRNNLRPQAQKS